jgi:hypothetical protein
MPQMTPMAAAGSTISTWLVSCRQEGKGRERRAGQGVVGQLRGKGRIRVEGRGRVGRVGHGRMPVSRRQASPAASITQRAVREVQPHQAAL